MKQIGRPEVGTYKALVPRMIRGTWQRAWVPAMVREIRQHEGAKRRLLCIVNGHRVSLEEWWPYLWPIDATEYKELLNEQSKPRTCWQDERTTGASRRARL